MLDFTVCNVEECRETSGDGSAMSKVHQLLRRKRQAPKVRKKVIQGTDTPQASHTRLEAIM